MVERDAEATAATTPRRSGSPEPRGPPGGRARPAAPVRHLDDGPYAVGDPRALLWNVERHAAIVAPVLSGFLHYVALVITNAGREIATSLTSMFVTGPARPTTLPPRAEALRGIRPPRRCERFSGGCVGRAARADVTRRNGHKWKSTPPQPQEKLRSIILFRCRAEGYP